MHLQYWKYVWQENPTKVSHLAEHQEGNDKWTCKWHKKEYSALLMSNTSK